MTYKGMTFNRMHGTANKLEYWCNFIYAKYWLADRLLVLCKVTNQTASEGLYATGQSDSPFGVAKYELDANGYCVIDFTDFYRTYRGARSIWLWYGVEDYDDPSVNVTTLFDDEPLGLINPTGVYIPSHISNIYGIEISAPLRMYASPYNAAKVQFEMFGTNGYSFSTGRVKFQPSETIVNFAQTIEVPSDTDVIEFWHLTDYFMYQNQVQEAPCDAKLALVEWVSFTGATRRHIFEVQKHKIDTGDSFSVLSLDGQPFHIKGRKDGFTLRLDDLCAYDLWYYSDVITSSNVNVSLDGGATWARVEVTNNSVTIPDGNGGNNRLEIKVNWKEYDPITLQ